MLAAVQPDVTALSANACVLRLHQGVAGAQVDAVGFNSTCLQHAAGLPLNRSGFQRARVGHDARAAVAHQVNHAIFCPHAARFNDAAVVDHRADQPVSGLRRHQYLAPFSLNQVAVLRQRADRTLVYRQAQQAAVVEVQGHIAASCQRNVAHSGLNHAFIFCLCGQQGDITAVASGDAALVRHCRSAGAAEAVVTRHQVVVGHAKG